MNTDYEWQRWNSTFAGEQYYYGDEAGPVARRTVRYAKPLLPPGASALDAGCGEGQDLAFLAEQGYRATGYEFTPEGARKTRQLLQTRKLHAEVIQCDLRTMSTSERYDIVIAINVIQFLGEDAPHCLRTLMEMVNPGGVVGLSLFACDSGESIEGTIYRTSVETLLQTFAGWQPFEAAKLWQWGAGGQAQPFVTLVARKPRLVCFNP
ncbi:MAG TPA: class I SAM-dependent methyltransferase [Abditibacteriaceae bacterium]|jgi:cyclopropane fatty-acyl-phospholipid synthase-like methyltransferase